MSNETSLRQQDISGFISEAQNYQEFLNMSPSRVGQMYQELGYRVPEKINLIEVGMKVQESISSLLAHRK